MFAYVLCNLAIKLAKVKDNNFQKRFLLKLKN